MAGLVPAIHVFLSCEVKTWMAATSAGLTIEWFLSTHRLRLWRCCHFSRGKFHVREKIFADYQP
jgi:hypothetical protein